MPCSFINRYLSLVGKSCLHMQLLILYHKMEKFLRKVCLSIRDISQTTVNFNKVLLIRNIRFFSVTEQLQWAQASLFLRFRDHAQAPHTRWDSSGLIIGPSQRPLMAIRNTHKRQITTTPASEGPQTHTINRAARNVRQQEENSVPWVMNKNPLHNLSGLSPACQLKFYIDPKPTVQQAQY